MSIAGGFLSAAWERVTTPVSYGSCSGIGFPQPDGTTLITLRHRNGTGLDRIHIAMPTHRMDKIKLGNRLVVFCSPVNVRQSAWEKSVLLGTLKFGNSLK